MNKNMYKNRLLKLAEHLEHGELGHKVFDFRFINNTPDSDGNTIILNKNECGTNGCAMGELPIIFPRSWKFEDWSIRRLTKNSKDIYWRETVAKFFNLTNHELSLLFTSPDQYSAHSSLASFDITLKKYPNCKKMSVDASRYQVASNIREFIKTKYKD